MKKTLTILIASSVIFASCGTYQGEGAYNGAWFGSLLGSAIGGIADGPHGSDVGTIIGVAGGAIIGSAIGAAADKSRNEDLEQYYAEKDRLAMRREARKGTASSGSNYDSFNSSSTDSGFDSSNSGDDRIDIDFGTESSYPEASVDATTKHLEIRNARFIDTDGNNIITRGEKCEIVFDVFNSSNAVARNIEPVIIETTGNKHILVSPAVLIESLAPNKGIRYTARVVADRSLKNATAHFTLCVMLQGTVATKAVDFTVPCQKK